MSESVHTSAASSGAPPSERMAVRPERRAATIAGARTAAVRVASIAVSLVILVGLWQAVIKIFGLPSVEVASPADTFRAMRASTPILLANLLPTVVEAVLGYAFSAAIGIPLGLLLARPGKLSRVLNAGAVGAQIFPKIAIAPLFIVWWGFGYFPKVLFIFLMGFFPVAMNAAAGFASMPLEFYDLAEINGFGPLARLRRLQGPWALPQIFTGLKISASFAVIAALVAEFVGSSAGLGVLIIQTQTSLNIALMFAAILIVAVLGFIFYGLVSLIEFVAIPWHVSRRQKH